jgi:hypothetical protein
MTPITEPQEASMISKKAAAKFGSRFAIVLHNCDSPEMRSGVLRAKNNMLSMFEDETNSMELTRIFTNAFNKRLDHLEPLRAPRSQWGA